MEDKLYEEYRSLQQQGVKVKGWWFKTRVKQLLQKTQVESEAESQFKFSNAWFSGFKRRYKISLRRPTNKAQHIPTDKRELIRKFHRKICQEAAVGPQIGKLGQFTSTSMANVDQTPLPFTFTNGSTYETKGAKTVWVQGGSSGLDKRQCTVQLTLFANGVPRVKPLVIFRGTGKRITLRERLSDDRCVGVTFQENAWCDEPYMAYWIRNYWKPHAEGTVMLLLDQHKAQKTPSRGGSRGGSLGYGDPPSKLGLILKQALQIIIIIGAKIIISICTFKRYRTMSEDSRKKQCTTDIRTFFASERLV